MNQEKIGRLIAECRKEKNLTQAELAEKFGISNRAVSKWETGKCLPDASIMIELCKILGITVNELLCGERQVNTYESQTQLQSQLKKQKLRILINNLFLIVVGVFSVFEFPPALIFILFVLFFRNYYLIRKYKTIKRLIEVRN